MRKPEFYKGKEQTYLKHFFLEKYLQRVAFHIGFAYPRFVYVDGFSGPWRAQGDDLSDTSFRIALEQLNYVQTALADPPHHKQPKIEAIFVEKDPSAFTTLQQAVNEYSGSVKVKALPGTFESNIPKILQSAGTAFVFFFLDPTGWTGYPMEAIKPVLCHQRGEVIINFMYDHINRFINSYDPGTEASLDALFGTEKWRVLRDVQDREYAIVDFYREQVRLAGGFQFVTSTRILKPTHDRAYYHLIYATRNQKGIMEFRAVEKTAVSEQEQVRSTAKREAREDKSGQSELDLGLVGSSDRQLEQDRSNQLRRAEERIEKLLHGHILDYAHLAPRVLELPLVWESDLKALLLKMRDVGRIRIDGLGPRSRTPKPKCRLSLT
jgi:three-Cys-motif partner protein